MLSVEHDARAAMVLRRLLGNEVADATFDFYIGADDAGGAALFEAARKSHGNGPRARFALCAAKFECSGLGGRDGLLENERERERERRREMGP